MNGPDTEPLERFTLMALDNHVEVGTSLRKSSHAEQSERLMQVNGVDLCVQTFGDSRDPAILLVAGASSPMDWWEDEFCRRLAEGERLVVRYDLRDTGRSTSYPPGAPAYDEPDLVDDAVGLLAELSIEAAHVVGISMGGALAQRMALQAPDRVRSLTLIATSPAGPGGPQNPDLPPMAQELRTLFVDPRPEPDWDDHDAVIEHIIEGLRPLVGSYAFDERRVREVVSRAVDRTANVASMLTNHRLIERGAPTRPRLGEIKVPTLVIHGTLDPLFPLGHAEALRREIPGAELLALDGVGHEIPPPPLWDRVISALLKHTAPGWDERSGALAAEALDAGDPTGWFERLYREGDAGQVSMPWSREDPHPMLVEWAGQSGLDGSGRSAAVVGCGLGADAEFLASRGFSTVGFEISATALRIARRRHPDSDVDYQQADLLDPPPTWIGAFDLVVEIFTVQSLPRSMHPPAIANTAALVAPGGRLLVIAAADDANRPDKGPPWPLTSEEIESFAGEDLTMTRLERLALPHDSTERRWRAEFERRLPPDRRA